MSAPELFHFPNHVPGIWEGRGIKTGRWRADINLPADREPGPLSIITRLLAPERRKRPWRDRLRGDTCWQTLRISPPPGSVFYPGKDIRHPTLASWEHPAVVSVMDGRSAAPQIDADALIDARVSRRPGERGPDSFIDKLKILPHKRHKSLRVILAPQEWGLESSPRRLKRPSGWDSG